MLLITAAQMQELDQRTIKEFSIPGLILMENAGRGILGAVKQRCSTGLMVIPAMKTVRRPIV